MRTTETPSIPPSLLDAVASRVPRRVLLATMVSGSASLLLGCRPIRHRDPRVDGGEGYAGPPAAATHREGEARICLATEDNIEGPYFKPGAPRRRSLAPTGAAGERLSITGRVVSATSCAPLAGAVLEVWHADHTGAYDGAGYDYRGIIEAGDDGSFAVDTILPGRYLNGNRYRPAHVHVKLHASGHRSLTTQLYFEGDPYNATDPFLRRSLVVPAVRDSGHVSMVYDFALTET